jgi:nucleoside-diphosphate-sugar epimerase
VRILLTGAFGNIGTHALPHLLADGHTVRCFDVATPANRRAANGWQKRVETLWGDLRHPADVAAAVQGQDLVIHLAFVVPRLSVTGVNSEDRPDWARAVNVGGTLNLLAAMQACPRPPRLIFASSLHVYGRTQHLPPPRRVSDPVQPVEHYAWHKITCEEMVKASTVPWTILRFGAAMPVRLIVDPGLFDVPLNNRIEYVHAHDVGVAIVHAVHSSAVWGQTWLIGGGPRCQYVYREIVERVLTAVGIGMLPAAAFSTTPFATDWLDTAASQAVLSYQQRTLDDYITDVRAALGPRYVAVRLLRPVIRRRLLDQSPYWRRSRPANPRRPLRGNAVT